MRVSFTAFADDSVIRGELVLEGDRLSDFIPQEGPFEIERVTLEALDDGRSVSVAATTMARSDLIAITGSGPRGNKAQRVRTRHDRRTRVLADPTNDECVAERPCGSRLADTRRPEGGVPSGTPWPAGDRGTLVLHTVEPATRRVAPLGGPGAGL
jgi:hypothetical protein